MKTNDPTDRSIATTSATQLRADRSNKHSRPWETRCANKNEDSTQETPVPRRAWSTIDAGRSSDCRARVSSLLIGRTDHSVRPTMAIRGVTPNSTRLPRRGRSGFAPDSLFADLGRLPSSATSILITWLDTSVTGRAKSRREHARGDRELWPPGACHARFQQHRPHIPSSRRVRAERLLAVESLAAVEHGSLSVRWTMIDTEKHRRTSRSLDGIARFGNEWVPDNLRSWHRQTFSRPQRDIPGRGKTQCDHGTRRRTVWPSGWD
jgi:hypothetical protein